ncbi:hypothetical protein ACVWXN_007039 [Bradyrhizobium sp. i1.4.4]
MARANGALIVLHFGWAFLVQYGMGLILEQWPAIERTLPLNRVSDSVQHSSAGRPGLVHRTLAQKSNWKSEVALKRKSTDQSRSVRDVIPRAEMVILETDQEVE